jgi:DNA polymerase I
MTSVLPVLGPALRRAKKDPIARLLAAATAVGVRFRISGATLQVAGAWRLHPDDEVVLWRYLEDIRTRLEPPAPEVDLLEQLDVEVEVITDPGRAEAVLGELRGHGTLGFDIETTPIVGNGSAAPWIRITKDGRRAVHQPRPQDKDGLDPLRATVRLAQLYDPNAEMVYVIDFKHVPITVLEAITDLPLLIHNAAFEHVMLLAQGIRLRRTFCSLQLARLTYGAERGGLRLADIAADLLDLDLPKDEQVSDWGARRLSYSQLTYAAADAVVVHRVGTKLWAGLDAGARRAFLFGNGTVAPVAAMRLAGIPFDAAVHRQTIAGWEQTYAEARDAFVALTGEEPPAQGRARSSWLETRLPEDMRAWWPLTDSGLLRTRSADLDRLAAVPEIRPLLEVLTADKRLRGFGHNLLAKVGPDGRLHMDLKAAATKSGRCSCSDPNLQQLPQDVRKAVVADDGRVLVIADYGQIEFRCACELSGDTAMRQIFCDGADMHVLNAEDFIGASLDTLPKDEREIARNKAKRIGFGVLYGSGARGLVASAWSMYRIEMSEGEAQLWKDRFYARYPQLRAWQQETAETARVTGVLRSIAGRPLRVEWEPIQPLRWTLCCNYGVQSSAADAMLLAMARVHAALAGRDARLILQIHDELVVECAAELAPEIERLLTQHMTDAYLELFPAAPTLNLVDVASRKCWAKPPKAAAA